MPTPVHAEHEVPAGVPVVFRELTATSWAQALEAALHDGSELVSRQESGDGGVVLTIRRRLPDGVPGPLLRFLPADRTVVQTDTWEPQRDGACRGTWTVAVPGAPGTLCGTSLLEPTPSGTRWVVDGAVRLSIPMVGGKVERYLAPLVEQLVGVQADVLRGRV